MLGEQFQSHMVGHGDSHLFHIPCTTTMNKLLRDETGVDDTTDAGVLLNKMVSLAKKIFKGEPLVLQHDERKVNINLCNFYLLHTVQKYCNR